MKTVVVEVCHSKGLKFVAFTAVDNDFGPRLYDGLSKVGKYLDTPKSGLTEGEFYRAPNQLIEEKYYFNFNRTTIFAAVFDAAKEAGFQFKDQLPSPADTHTFVFQQ